jgi:KAP-like P-loop domain-containing protein
MAVAQSSVLISHHPADRRHAQRLFDGLQPAVGGSAIVRMHSAEPAVKARMQKADDPVDLSADAIEHADLILLIATYRYVNDPPSRAELLRAFDLHTAGQAKAVLVRTKSGDLPELPEDLATTLPVIPSGGRFLAEPSGVTEVVAYVGGVIASPARSPAPLELSPSVRRATAGMADDDVSAYSIVTEILRLHPEYGNGLASQLSIAEPPRAKTRTATEWLQDVRELFKADAEEALHGRTVIRGLALLEPDLTKQLLDKGFLSSLEGELMPLLPRLSARGRELWDPGDVPTLADRPARVDKLRRREFARGLADMLAEERRNSEDATGGRGESFLVQLHGPWGSGKSTLLGFMKKELEDMDWIVVEFNAWQQERLEAPWWSLMTAVHRTSRRALARAHKWWRVARLLGMELWWRFKMGWPAYLLLPVVLGLLWYAISNDWFDSATAKDGWLAETADVAKAAGAILSVVVVVYGAVRGLARSFAAGSAKGADTFLKTSQDPMRTLRRRYERIVETAGRPIAVFVDDLDRCQPDYVVEVLQGIQTLLIDAPVTYVVAADRRWLFDSYNKVYSGFDSVAQDPGRPLGHLFLEKTFQLAASLPTIPVDVRDEYWRGLVVHEDGDDEATTARLTDQAAQRVEEEGLEGTLEAVEQSRQLSAAEEAATRAAASKRLGDEDIRREVEHRLIPFAPLLEANPRAMKRLLNAYRIELRRTIAEGRQVGPEAVTPEQLALWTIVSMRWPLLADELARHPEELQSDTDLPSSNGLAELRKSEEVRAVFDGEGVRARLTERDVRALVGARPRQR